MKTIMIPAYISILWSCIHEAALHTEKHDTLSRERLQIPRKRYMRTSTTQSVIDIELKRT